MTGAPPAPEEREACVARGWRSAGGSGAPLRMMMTVDAVGGVWRYAMVLARALAPLGVDCVFAGLGPGPSAEQADEAGEIGRLIWLDEPLDWMVDEEAPLERLPQVLEALVGRFDVDLLHLNLPSQACGLNADVPVLAVCHSCVVTWWRTMRNEPLPEAWRWKALRNRRGFQRADAIVVPSGSLARDMGRCYGALPHLQVVHNATDAAGHDEVRADYIFAAARWWDEGKNGATLDAAARHTDWPVVTAGAVHGPGGQHAVMRNVKREGVLSHAAVLGLMQKAGIVVSPSLYEPFGLAALEGARAGAALVLSDIPTYRELWDGAALFFDPSDAHALAETLNHVSGDPKLRFEMGDRARERSRRFTPKVQAEAMAGIYGRLAGARKVRGLRS